ncbi:MAG: hypothetical protein R3B96_11015 [Pirellulaceae bacterium]
MDQEADEVERDDPQFVFQAEVSADPFDSQGFNEELDVDSHVESNTARTSRPRGRTAKRATRCWTWLTKVKVPRLHETRTRPTPFRQRKLWAAVRLAESLVQPQQRSHGLGPSPNWFWTSLESVHGNGGLVDGP